MNIGENDVYLKIYQYDTEERIEKMYFQENHEYIEINIQIMASQHFFHANLHSLTVEANFVTTFSDGLKVIKRRCNKMYLILSHLNQINSYIETRYTQVMFSFEHQTTFNRITSL